MPGISELFCGCGFPSVARATATTIDPPPPTAGPPTAVAAPSPLRGGGASSSTSSVTSSATLGGAQAGRGLVRAPNYEADPRDELDVALSQHLRALDPDFAPCLLVRRLARTDYELDGRRVRLHWATPDSGGTGAKREVVAREGDEGDPLALEMPLSAYLKQASDIAASLAGRSPGSPPVARVPVSQRLTFTAPGVAAVPGSQTQQMSDAEMGVERIRSMRMACQQARLREHAAAEYGKRERERSIGRQPSPAPQQAPANTFGPHLRSQSVTSIGSRGSNGRACSVDPPSAPTQTLVGLRGNGASAVVAPTPPTLLPAGFPRAAYATPPRMVSPAPGPRRSNSAHSLPTLCLTPGAHLPPVPAGMLLMKAVR